MAAAVLVGPAGARAAVERVADGEPPFTKGTSNTWFFGFSRATGATDYTIGYSHDGQSDGGESPIVDAGVVHVARAGLASGSVQAECATEQGTAGGLPFSAAPVCSATTMDSSRPTATVGLDAGNTLTNDPRLAVRVGYSEDVSYPWPGGSTFLCPSLESPTGPCRTSTPAKRVFSFDSGCSSPATNVGPGARRSAWGCTYDLTRLPGGAPDGTWYLCAVEADYAIPDNPGTADQFAGHTSDEANLSIDTPAACGSVVLDRTPPALRLVVHGRSGHPVSLAASAHDHAGVGPFTWIWGDGSAPVHGPLVRHAYRRPGRYRITVAVTDNAGNTAVKSVVLRGTKSGLLLPACRSGRLHPSAPRRVAAGARSVLLHFHPTCGGTVRMSLHLGRLTVARAATALPRHGKFRVRLPLPRLAAGTYRLRVTFKPDGGRTGRPWSVSVRIGRRRARASSAPDLPRPPRQPRTTRGAGAPTAP